MKTFELNGKAYETDTETLEVLRSIIPAARTSGDGSAVQAVMAAGEMSGRIIQKPRTYTASYKGRKVQVTCPA